MDGQRHAPVSVLSDATVSSTLWIECCVGARAYMDALENALRTEQRSLGRPAHCIFCAPTTPSRLAYKVVPLIKHHVIERHKPIALWIRNLFHIRALMTQFYAKYLTNALYIYTLKHSYMFGPQGVILREYWYFSWAGSTKYVSRCKYQIKEQPFICYVAFVKLLRWILFWRDVKVNGQRHALDSHKVGLLGSPPESCVYVSDSLLDYRFTCWALRVGHPVLKHCTLFQFHPNLHTWMEPVPSTPAH
jgi:hypothetical protein